MSFEPHGTIEDIVPSVRPRFAELLELAEELGMQPRIRSAGRTCAMQDALAAEGASTTRVSGCRSWHVLGRAIDLDLTPNVCDTYTTLGLEWEDMGGVWGGRWTSFGECGDAGHFQFAPTAVPEALCPDDDCETARQRYLASEAEPRLASMMAAALALTLGVYLLYRAW